MASVFGMTEPPSDIDYSIADGRIRSFKFRGQVLFDERSGVEVSGWETRLVELVKECGLDQPSELGYHAFIYWMVDQGLIPPVSA